MILLNPGPVNLSPAVRKALTQPDLCHREPEFAELQDTIRRELLAIYELQPSEWAAILIAGSGTAAVEAMITSLVPEKGKILVIENGVYGERISRISQTYRMPHFTLHYKWGDGIDKLALERILEGDSQISSVAIVQHETTTGRLNDIAEIASICRPRGLQIFIDAVSSFGAEELDFRAWGITACAATANKCLHAAPGVSFVIVDRKSLPLSNSSSGRCYYLDLVRHCDQQDNHQTAFTQPVHLFYALSQALLELKKQGGWRGRGKYYEALANHVRDGLSKLNIKPLLKKAETSVVLSSYYLPNNLSYDQLHAHLKKNHFVIYAGQGNFGGRIFRISTMGDITMENMEKFLAVFRQALAHQSENVTERPR